MTTLDSYKEIENSRTAIYRAGYKSGIALAIQYLEFCKRSCRSKVDKRLLSDTIDSLLREMSDEDAIIDGVFLTNSDRDIAYSDEGNRKNGLANENAPTSPYAAIFPF